MLRTNLLKYAFTVLIIIFFLPTENFPQNNLFHFKQISIDEGLPTNIVNCITQDKKGFIWLGTERGLARYDGYNFKIYRHKKGDNNTISNEEVTSMLEDSAGNFWIGTRRGGLNKFDRYLNKFSCLKHIPNDNNSLPDNEITALVENNGAIWAGTRVGLSKLDSKGNKFANYLIGDSAYSGKLIAYLSNKGIAHSAVLKIIKDKDILWIGTSGGLTEFNLKNNFLTNYLIDGKGGGDIRSVIIEDGSNLLTATGKGLFRFNKTTKQFQQILTEPINDLLKTKDGKLWCATEGMGIILYDIGNGIKNIFNKENGTADGIISDNFNSVFIDSARSIWFTSPDEGINLLNPVYKQFNVYSHSGQGTNGLSSNIVTKGFSDKGNVTWFPTNGAGLDKYSAESKSYVHLKESLLREDKVNCVIRDDLGRLWAGTGGGLYSFRFNSPAFEKISFSSYLIKDHAVNAIAEDRDGNIWTGINDNLVKYSEQTNETVIINLKHDSSSASNNFKINGILNDNDNLWVSTSNGLYRYEIKKNSLNLFQDSDPFGIENQFQALLQDWEGMIWLGSREGGLKSFNPQTGSFTSYRAGNGLPSNNIVSLQEDAEGYLWVGTDKGLVNFNNKNGCVIVYTTSDGLPGNKFLQNSSWVSPEGEFYFGTTNGTVSFFPANIISNKYPPPIVLSSFKIFNKEAELNYEPSYATEIDIPYTQSDISFEFAALNYIDPARNQYAYKLEGFSGDWSYIKSLRKISFADLAPGSYTLRIKASNNDGKWNETGLAIKLVIIPPWYKAWWAYILYLIIAISIYFGLRKYELRKVMLKNDLRLKRIESEILLEADKVKSNFFNRISNEFKTPLSKITESITELKKKLITPGDKKTLDLIEQNTKSLLRQINQLIDFSKLEAGSMKLQVSKNDLIPFLRGLVINMEPAAKLKNIELALHSPVDHLNIYFDPDKIERILFNLVENAIKFTSERGGIFVIVELRSDRLYIKVKDNGIGISAEKMSSIFRIFEKADNGSTKQASGLGMGLILTKKLVSLHKGDIQVTSAPGMGSTFTFWIYTDEKVYHYSEMEEVNNVNLTFRPLSKGHEISSTFQDQTEKQIVLVVENNSEMRRLIASQLEENYAVYEYPNGLEGFERAKEIIPDIIIFDATNAGIDGFEFCGLVKNDEAASHIPMILLNDKYLMDSKITKWETGADDYLAKPFSKLDLLMKIKNQISLRRKYRDVLCKETLSGIKSVTGSEIKLSTADKSFITKVLHVVGINYSHFDFNIEQICSYTGLSQTALRRKMSALFNKSPLEFILKFRLYKAYKFIEEGKTGTEASIAVGFENLSYFSKCYRAEFGKLPPESGN
ncbi:MAG: two-component regulator propeller domain-containing protein [Ignavibacteriaceae bacterium]|nr:two-component regulator propeller domain-containing protein [Ignavibacteriaceae bacterium]